MKAGRKIKLFSSCSIFEKAAQYGFEKLRMTGFECFTTFVIRRAKHILKKDAARH
jgi:hypothetical protein